MSSNPANSSQRSQKIGDLPDAVEKRDYVYGRRSGGPEKISSFANKFLAAGWIYDAIEFAKGSANWGLIESELPKLVDSGDVFLLLKAFAALDTSGGERSTKFNRDELLNRAAQNAERLEKFSYAKRAYEVLDQQDQIARINAIIQGSSSLGPGTSAPGTPAPITP